MPHTKKIVFSIKRIKASNLTMLAQTTRGSATTISNKQRSNNANTTSKNKTKGKQVLAGHGNGKEHLRKTEMCNSILRGMACRYGAKCVFAHHRDELLSPTFKERWKNGKIDSSYSDTSEYLTRPCFEIVSTGMW